MVSVFALMSMMVFAQEFPVTIEHKFGSTTVDAPPVRVVSLGYNEEDPLFALGVKPLAVRYWLMEGDNGVLPWAQDAAANATPELLNLTEINYEAILAFQPDFISAQYAGIDKQTYEMLSRIAPTLAPSADYPDYGMPWEEMTLTLGKVFGKEADAQAAITAVHDAQAQAKELLAPYAGQEVAVILENTNGGYYAYTAEDSRGQFFESLGFRIPEVFTSEDSFYINISEERADLLNVDLLVFIANDEQDAQNIIMQDPLLSQLDVVKDDHVIYVTEGLRAAISYNTVLSIPYALNEIVPIIQAVLTP